MKPPSELRTMNRRQFLALGGTAAIAGCSAVPRTTATAPSIDCSPTDPTWPMYGYTPDRTGHLPARELPPSTADTRRFSQTGTQPDGGGSIEAPPVLDGEVTYIAGDVRIEARSTRTGERIWETDPEASVPTGPVLACGTLYVSTNTETLALDPGDGTVRWRADVGARASPSASPVALDDTLFIVGGGVTAVDAETGRERWRAHLDHSPHGIAVADRVYVGAGSNGSGEVAAVTHDGDVWWRTTEPGEVYAAPAYHDGTVYAVSKGGTLTALAAADGGVEWQAAVDPGVVTPPAVADGRLVVEAGNGDRTMALDAGTGERLWTLETGVSSGAPIVTGDRVLATGANTGIHVLGASTGDRLRHWPVDNVGSQPVIGDGRVYYRGWDVSDVFVIGG